MCNNISQKSTEAKKINRNFRFECKKRIVIKQITTNNTHTPWVNFIDLRSYRSTMDIFLIVLPMNYNIVQPIYRTEHIEICNKICELTTNLEITWYWTSKCYQNDACWKNCVLGNWVGPDQVHCPSHHFRAHWS